MNTNSVKLMLFGIMLLMFALVLALVAGRIYPPFIVGDGCTTVVILVALAGLVSGFLGLRRDD